MWLPRRISFASFPSHGTGAEADPSRAGPRNPRNGNFKVDYISRMSSGAAKCYLLRFGNINPWVFASEIYGARDTRESFGGGGGGIVVFMTATWPAHINGPRVLNCESWDPKVLPAVRASPARKLDLPEDAEHPWRAKPRLLNLHACQFMFLIEIYVLMSRMQRRNYKAPRKILGLRKRQEQEPGTLPQFQSKLITWNIHSSSRPAIYIRQPPEEKIGSQVHSTGCITSGFCLWVRIYRKCVCRMSPGRNWMVSPGRGHNYCYVNGDHRQGKLRAAFGVDWASSGP